MRRREQNKRCVENGDGAGNGGRERRVARGHVVQGTVRLDVLELRAFLGRDAGNQRDLREHEVLGLNGRDRDLTPAEILAIGESGMGANGHAVRAGHANRGTNDVGAARVESRGHARGRNRRHQPLVVAAAFADVRVQVNRTCNSHSRECTNKRAPSYSVPPCFTGLAPPAFTAPCRNQTSDPPCAIASGVPIEITGKSAVFPDSWGAGNDNFVAPITELVAVAS
jgi:hypothetical protein